MLRIRLARRGRRGSPSYRIVVTPSNASRDGRSVSDLGFYNPLRDPSDFRVDLDAARDWIVKGAQPSDRVWKILEVAQPGFKQSIVGNNGAASSPDETGAPPKVAVESRAQTASAKPAATAAAAPKARAKTAKSKPARKSAARARSKATAKASGKKTAPKSKAKS